jgi:hypothetical protein
MAMTTRTLTTGALALAWVAWLGSSAAAAPKTASYTAELTSPSGAAFSGSVTASVALFPGMSGGTALYTEDFGSVTVSGGQLALTIGADDPDGFEAALMGTNTLWAQFTLGGETLLPRQRVVSVPFATKASDALALDGIAAEDYLADGDIDIDGPLAVNGLTVIDMDGNWVGGSAGPSGGQSPDFMLAKNPMVAMGFKSPMATEVSSLYTSWIYYPEPFPAMPMFAYTIDESLNNAGPSYYRARVIDNHRIGLRGDNQADGLYWMAIEEGVHTIDGKMVQAGRFTKAGGVTTNDTIFFPQLFAEPPVVLLFVDESGNDSGSSYVRIINEVATGGFQIQTDSTADWIQWIAMDAGEYEHGGLYWKAGVWETGNSCSTSGCTYAYGVNFDGKAPGILLQVHDVNNSGANYARTMRVDPTTVKFYMNSTAEKVHYVAFELP